MQLHAAHESERESFRRGSLVPGVTDCVHARQKLHDCLPERISVASYLCKSILQPLDILTVAINPQALCIDEVSLPAVCITHHVRLCSPPLMHRLHRLKSSRANGHLASALIVQLVCCHSPRSLAPRFRTLSRPRSHSQRRSWRLQSAPPSSSTIHLYSTIPDANLRIHLSLIFLHNPRNQP